MKMRRPTLKRWVLSVLFSLILIYVGSYCVLSIGGRYEPGLIGLGGVKQYSWAPRGFVAGFVWQRRPMMLYAPLYFFDERYWHTPEKVDSGRYPVDWVDRTDIWKVYEAGEAETKKSKGGS